MVCYYASLADYRPAEGRYNVQDIPVEQCTHLIYAFALLDSKTLTIKSGDPSLDTNAGNFGRNNYGAFVNLKSRNPQAKFLLGLGGWTDSQSTKYSQLVSEHDLRSAFITHVVTFLTDHKFDGLDLNWEFPGYFEDRTGEKEGYLLWVQELRAAFEPIGLLLTASVAADKDVIDRGYDVVGVSEALHQLHILAYNRYEPTRVSNHASLFSTPDSNPQFSVDFTVQYWMEKGAPADKMVLGVPLYGRSWTLSGSDISVGAEASGPGSPGPLMVVEGRLSYHEICLAERKDGWTKVTAADGPHLTNGSQWVGYDDVESVTRKYSSTNITNTKYSSTNITNTKYSSTNITNTIIKYSINNTNTKYSSTNNTNTIIKYSSTNNTNTKYSSTNITIIKYSSTNNTNTKYSSTNNTNTIIKYSSTNNTNTKYSSTNNTNTIIKYSSTNNTNTKYSSTIIKYSSTNNTNTKYSSTNTKYSSTNNTNTKYSSTIIKYSSTNNTNTKYSSTIIKYSSTNNTNTKYSSTIIKYSSTNNTITKYCSTNNTNNKYSFTNTKYSSTNTKYSSIVTKYSSTNNTITKYSSTNTKYSSTNNTNTKYSSTNTKYSSTNNTNTKYFSTNTKYSSTNTKYSSTNIYCHHHPDGRIRVPADRVHT
ncbi:hypothetical protein Pcinc_009500 [Petrolisthes cinctipes]|uniref:GH18 domain-containing protein n=1 Tax=Petrolisthes cinctipes TaxID=88211 RepID=A0AAE1KVH6_PETCI|nr:hypothetical protein Pcinc_009500 [Petrolisthes cinctipes]